MGIATSTASAAPSSPSSSVVSITTADSAAIKQKKKSPSIPLDSELDDKNIGEGAGADGWMAPEKELTPFPKFGVKLSFIDDFIEDCGGLEALEGVTTTDLCEYFVKPATSRSQSSYCDILHAMNHPAVGTPNVFISHAWKFFFLDVVAILRHHFRDEPAITIWFDVFSCNQHNPIDVSSAWLNESFKKGIGNIGRTILVLGSLEHPLSLQRSWCLYEMYCTAQTDSKFEVAMTPSHLAKFMEEVSRDDRTVITKIESTINYHQSHSSNTEDKEHILDVARVTTGVGIHVMTLTTFQLFCDWILAAMKIAVVDEPDVINQLNLKHAIAAVSLDRGKKEQAEQLYKETLAKKKKFVGPSHTSTLNSINGLASLYMQEQQYAKAEPLYDECIMKRKVELGEKHPGTYSAMHNRALLHIQQNQLGEAETLLTECVQGRRELCGRSHSDTLESVQWLAFVFERCRPIKATRAERMYLDCLTRRKESLGTSHPQTLSTMHNLAIFYDGQDRTDVAEPLFIECIELKTQVFGATNLTTVVTQNALGNMYLHQERWEEAEFIFADCMEKRKELLGVKHRDTCVSMEGLAEALHQQGKHQQAQPIYVAIVVARKELHGGQHPKSVKASNDLRTCRGYLY